jgi:hypothetical protein
MTTPQNGPTLTRLPRRLAAPAELGATPRLEMIHQPLYSAGGIDNAALPNELLLFQYAIGGTVSGAGAAAVPNANLFHTNMETAGFLAAPKVHTTTGIRVVFAQLEAVATAVLTDPSLGTTPENTDWADDLQGMLYSGFLRFAIGPKDYVRAPLFLVPGNTGIEGVSSMAAGFATNNFMRVNVLHNVGRYYGLPQYPTLIASQQSFVASLNWRFATNYTVLDDHLIWVILDGILGREVS